MTQHIQQSQLRNDNAEIMRRVAAGESFVVTVHGRTVADLVPHRHPTPTGRQLVPAVELDALLIDDGPGPDPTAWGRDVESLDEMLDDRRFGDAVPDDAATAGDDPWDKAE